MGDRTKIAWAQASWNPLRGCTRVSAGCQHCYAERVAARFCGEGQPYQGLAKMVTRPDGSREARWTGKVEFVEHMLDQPLRWRRPRRIFVNSMSDLFHESVPDEWIDRVFAVMALAPQHQFQILSKRPTRMREYLSDPRTGSRVAALAYDAAYEQGTGNSISRGARRTGNRCRGSDMALKEEAREAEAERRDRISEGGWCNQLRTSAGGISDSVRLPINCNDDPRKEDGNRSAPGDLDEHQRTDTVRTDDQPHQRHQRRQSPRQFGAGDPLGAAQACNRSSERQSQSAEGQQASKDPAARRRRDSHQGFADLWNDDQSHSCKVSDENEGNLCDLQSEDLAAHLTWPLPNVWLGVSVEDQATANERIPLLLDTPAAIRWISAEPLLSLVDISPWLFGGDPPCPECPKDIDCDCGWQTRRELGQPHLSWIVVGGESGPGARPFDIEWARLLVYQCKTGAVSVFVKQMGSRPIAMKDKGAGPEPWPLVLDSRSGTDPAEWPEDLRIQEYPA